MAWALEPFKTTVLVEALNDPPFPKLPPRFRVPAPLNEMIALVAFVPVKLILPETVTDPVLAVTCEILDPEFPSTLRLPAVRVPAPTAIWVVLLFDGVLRVAAPDTVRLLVLFVKFRLAAAAPLLLFTVTFAHASARPLAIVTVRPAGMLAVSPATGKTPALVPQVVLLFQLPSAIAVNAPGFTVKELLVPLAEPPVRVAVIVRPAPDCKIVTLCDASTPLVNVPDTDGMIVPAFVVRSTVAPVPVNCVTVALDPSRAVILMLNAVPATCVPMLPPAAASTRKLLTRTSDTFAVAVLVHPLAELVAVTVYVPDALTSGFAVVPPETIPGPAQLKPVPVVVAAESVTLVVKSVSVPPVALAPGAVPLAFTGAVAVLVQPLAELVTVTVNVPDALTRGLAEVPPETMPEPAQLN
jgi:hypothetical protein